LADLALAKGLRAGRGAFALLSCAFALLDAFALLACGAFALLGADAFLFVLLLTLLGAHASSRQRKHCRRQQGQSVLPKHRKSPFPHPE
jgi:hypothetical protein